METITNQFGTLTGLTTAIADFYHTDVEDENGFIRPDDEIEPYLSNIPAMPATGRNTRQDGSITVALMGSLSFETKWSAIDLTDETRNKVAEEDRVRIRQYNNAGDVLLSDGTYIISGVTEFDDPVLGFAYAVLNLKESK